MTPLASCIMPTFNRRAFIPAAIQSFLDQTYDPRELVIVDDGDDRVRDLIPIDPRIRYIELAGPAKLSTGKKRNACCELATGEIICHFDDDDWSAPTRIADQVERLVKTGKPITGYGTLLFWDRTTQRAKRYRAPYKGYVCGTSLAYLKSFWRMRPFRDLQEASDNAFVNPILRQIAAADGTSKLVARIHDCHHTSSKKGITEVVPTSMIPDHFWDNERLLAFDHMAQSSGRVFDDMVRQAAEQAEQAGQKVIASQQKIIAAFDSAINPTRQLSEQLIKLPKS